MINGGLPLLLSTILLISTCLFILQDFLKVLILGFALTFCLPSPLLSNCFKTKDKSTVNWGQTALLGLQLQAFAVLLIGLFPLYWKTLHQPSMVSPILLRLLPPFQACFSQTVIWFVLPFAFWHIAIVLSLFRSGTIDCSLSAFNHRYSQYPCADWRFSGGILLAETEFKGGS